jgi:hypothetical protein
VQSILGFWLISCSPKRHTIPSFSYRVTSRTLTDRGGDLLNHSDARFGLWSEARTEIRVLSRRAAGTSERNRFGMTTTFARACAATRGCLPQMDVLFFFSHTNLLRHLYSSDTTVSRMQKNDKTARSPYTYRIVFQQLFPGFTWQQHLNSTAARGFNVP